MTVTRKGNGCDPCCNDWKEKLKFLWEKYREAVRGIKADNETYWPDGEGIVNMPGLLSAIKLTDLDGYYNLMIANDIEALRLIERSTYWTLTVTVTE